MNTFLIGGDMAVSRLGYGCMRLCGAGVWHFHADRTRHMKVLRRAAELGVTLFDTSDAYGPEINEYQIAEALRPYTGLTIATKGGLTRPDNSTWQTSGRPKHLRVALRNSLRRLEVEHIDLYQLHAPDPEVPLADQIGQLARDRDAGLIRHIGVSNFSVDQLKEAMAITRIATVQNRYNLTFRDSEPVLQLCEANGIGFLPWYPLAAGALARPGGPLDRIATKHGAAHGQVALAWLLARSPVMLPIPGTSSVAHLEENLAGSDLKLDPEDIAELDTAA
jgi:aryl-alcohol dehydrogenase-like predicted oxidoreductase